MFVSHNREKLINAIIYFVQNTKHCHTLKLFKLLNFLDFEHYRQTGFSVTGQRYVAWQQGPAPTDLWHEFSAPQADLQRSIAVNWIKDNLTGEPKRRDIRPKAPFNPAHFTKRELEIMEQLAFFFKEAKCDDMSQVSHARNLPWGMVFQGGKGLGQPIPYELVFTAKPILEAMPSISEAEFEHRKTAFREIDQSTV